MSIAKTTVIPTAFVPVQARVGKKRPVVVSKLREDEIISPLRIRLARIVNVITIAAWIMGVLMYFL